MSNVRTVVLLICFAVASFGADRQILQKEFNAKKDLYEELQIDFELYTSMEELHKEAYKQRLTQLLDVQNLTKHLTEDAQSTKDTFEIFSPYINLHSYFIAKYAPQEELILPSLVLMSGVLKYTKEGAYLETYMLLLAHNKKFDEPLKFYPKFIECYDVQEAKDNFEIVKQLALASAIQNNDVKLLQKLKDVKADFNAPLANGRLPIFEAMFSKEEKQPQDFCLKMAWIKKAFTDMSRFYIVPLKTTSGRSL